jgi:transposase
VSIHKVPIYGLQMSVSCASVAQVPLCTFRYGSRKSPIFVTYLELSGRTLTIAEVAERFCVGIASVVRWLKEIEPRAHGYRKRKVDMAALARDVEDYPDAYQSERAARFGVHQNAICHGLKKLNVTYSESGIK